jgi:hypothetical protein
VGEHLEVGVSATEDIFLSASLNPDEATHTLADALGFELQHDERGVFLGSDHVPSVGDYVVAEVSANYLADPQPGTPQALDQYQLLLSVHKKGVRDWAAQRRAGRAVFDRIVETLRWPALLTHDSQLAIADWNPEQGLREFPDNTSVDDQLLLMPPDQRE